MDQKWVLTVGDAAVDWIVPIEGFPVRGGQSLSAAPNLQSGGSIGNTAVGLARLGVQVAFLGKLGDDLHGRFLYEHLQKEGVITRFTVVDPDAFTPVIICVIDQDGERTFFACSKGSASMMLRPEEVDPEAVGGASGVHVSGVTLIEQPCAGALIAIMRLARKLGVPVSFDPNVRSEGKGLSPEYRERLREALTLADIILTSAAEIAHLVPESSPADAARSLSSEGRVVVIRDGERGAVGFAGNQIEQVPAFAIQPLNALGAGDAFNAGFLYGQRNQLGLKESLRWANAVAAYKIQTRVGQGLPYLDEVKQLLLTIPTRILPE